LITVLQQTRTCEVSCIREQCNLVHMFTCCVRFAAFLAGFYPC